MTRRIIVLLGAGASRDAGLPLTSQLAERIVAKFNDRTLRMRGVQELNFVYSAMVGHQGEDGSDPLRAVNIETLISAVRLLQARDSHEVAPFVSAWKPGAFGFSSDSRTRNYGRAAQSAVGRALENPHWGGDDLAELIARIARDVTRQSNTGAFRVLEAELLGAIRSELFEIDSVDYLVPLAELAAAQGRGLDVITLNYDLTVETMARERGVVVDRGIERWVPGVPLVFDRVDGQINLIKLHGSVDWELEDNQPRTVHPPRIEVVGPDDKQPEPDIVDFGRRSPGQPWIVVGDREKLATDGPTLDLLNAAGEALNQADALVVVGYSFADAHVNSIIRNWMAASSDRTITVLDPAWPPYNDRGLRGDFARAYGGSDDWNRPGDVPRLSVIPQGTADSLREALLAFPSRPEIYAEAAWAEDPEACEVVIRLLGPTLTEASVSGNGTNVLDSPRVRVELLGQPWSPNTRRTASLGTFEQGATMSVYPVLPDDATSLNLAIEGDVLVGRRIVRIHLPIPPDTPRLAPPSPPPRGRR